MILKKELAEQLKKTARKVKYNAEFWDNFAEEILLGNVPAIDPRIHLRRAKTIVCIAQDLHAIMGEGEWESVDEPIRQGYYKIIETVFRGLDYKH